MIVWILVIQHFKRKVYLIQIIQKIMLKSVSGFDHLMKGKREELEKVNAYRLRMELLCLIEVLILKNSLLILLLLLKLTKRVFSIRLLSQ